MHYIAYVLTLLLIATAPSIAAPNGSVTIQNKQGLSYCEIKGMLDNQGAKETVEKLYSNWDKWNDLIKEIATGKHEWLEIAVKLRNGSDAHASEMLDFAVGEALENAPELVLQIAPDRYGLGDICSGPDIDDIRYSSYEKALGAVKRRIEAVGRINNKKMENNRDYCIEKLKESIPHLQHFFGVK